MSVFVGGVYALYIFFEKACQIFYGMPCLLTHSPLEILLKNAF